MFSGTFFVSFMCIECGRMCKCLWRSDDNFIIFETGSFFPHLMYQAPWPTSLSGFSLCLPSHCVSPGVSDARYLCSFMWFLDIQASCSQLFLSNQHLLCDPYCLDWMNSLIALHVSFHENTSLPEWKKKISWTMPINTPFPSENSIEGMSAANCVILKLPESGWSADWMLYWKTIKPVYLNSCSVQGLC